MISEKEFCDAMVHLLAAFPQIQPAKAQLAIWKYHLDRHEITADDLFCGVTSLIDRLPILPYGTNIVKLLTDEARAHAEQRHLAARKADFIAKREGKIGELLWGSEQENDAQS